MGPCFCTLFDKGYTSRALVMARSLLKHNPSAKLYCFCFDSVSYEIIQKLNIKGIVPVSLEEFEDEALKRARANRSWKEYLWTCTPSVLLYVLEKHKEEACIYLDADMEFYSPLEKVISELSSYSIGITPHRYSSEYDQTEVSGKYCVQFVYIKNNENGLKAAKWWRESCLEWCFDRVEPDRFGDQKYLDQWPKLFQEVLDVVNLGVGVAPWNIQQYEINPDKSASLIYNKKTIPFYFFHFHGVKKHDNNFWNFGSYKLSSRVKKNIYLPYVKKLEENDRYLQCEFSLIPALSKAPSAMSVLKSILKKTYNVTKLSCF